MAPLNASRVKLAPGGGREHPYAIVEYRIRGSNIDASDLSSGTMDRRPPIARMASHCETIFAECDSGVALYS